MNRILFAHICFLSCFGFVIAEDPPTLTEFKDKIAKLRNQAAAQQKQIEATFELEAAKCKRELLDALEAQRIDAMKSDRLDEAIKLRQLLTEYATLVVPLAQAPEPNATQKPDNPTTKNSKQNSRKSPEFFEWKHGEKPTKMIHKDAGICFLTHIHGMNSLNAEMAEVAIGDDGFWYLRGTTHQNNQFLFLRAAAVRYESFWPQSGKSGDASSVIGGK